MNYWLTLVLLGCNFAVLMYALGLLSRPFAQLFVAGLLFVVVLLAAGYASVEVTDSLLQTLFLLLSNLGVLAAAIQLRARDAPRPVGRSEGRPVQRVSPVWSLLVGLTSIGALVQGAGGLSGVLSSWITVVDQLADANFWRILATLLYVVSVALMYAARRTGASLFALVLPALVLMMFALILRVKIFFVPVLFALILPADHRAFRIRRLVVAGAAFLALYMVVMFARWLGDVSTSDAAVAAETFERVSDAGVEREMFDQFTSVMAHYRLVPPHGGAAYARLLLEPVDFLFGTSLSPPNPMYVYYTIWNEGLTVEGGSAHPTLYGDSYAGFAWLGICVPGLLLWALGSFEHRIFGRRLSSMIVAGACLSLPLLIRGSIYYALLYFAAALVLRLAIMGLVDAVRAARILGRGDQCA